MSYRCVQAPFLKIRKQQLTGVSRLGWMGFQGSCFWARWSCCSYDTPVEMPPADLAYWMGKFVLEVRKNDGQEYSPKSIYALVCCFKRCYEQHGVFDVNPVICLALYIQHQLFSLENSCCCICAGQTNVLSHDLYLAHFWNSYTMLSHAVVCTCSWKSVVIAHLSVL